MSSIPGEPTDTNFRYYSPPNTFFDPYDEPGLLDDHMDAGESEVEIIDSPGSVNNQEESDEGLDASEKAGSDTKADTGRSDDRWCGHL